MTQQELESYLWGAANILRGLVDADLGQAGQVRTGQAGLVQRLQTILQRAMALVPDERDRRNADPLDPTAKRLLGDRTGRAV